MMVMVVEERAGGSGLILSLLPLMACRISGKQNFELYFIIFSFILFLFKFILRCAKAQNAGCGRPMGRGGG